MLGSHTSSPGSSPGGRRFWALASRLLAVCCTSQGLRVLVVSALGLDLLEKGPGVQNSVQPDCVTCPDVMRCVQRVRCFFSGRHSMGNAWHILPNTAWNNQLLCDARAQDCCPPFRNSGRLGASERQHTTGAAIQKNWQKHKRQTRFAWSGLHGQ